MCCDISCDFQICSWNDTTCWLLCYKHRPNMAKGFTSHTLHIISVIMCINTKKVFSNDPTHENKQGLLGILSLTCVWSSSFSQGCRNQLTHMFSDGILKQYILFKQLSLNCCTFVTVKCSQLKCSNVKKPDYVIARLTTCDITFEESLGPGAVTVSHWLKGAFCFPLGYFSACLNNPLSKIEHCVFTLCSPS